MNHRLLSAIRSQRALSFLILLVLGAQYLLQINPVQTLFTEESISEVFTDPESALSAGIRLPLSRIPLDLLEQVVGLPSSVAEELARLGDDLCVPDEDRTSLDVLLSVRGVGPVRAKQIERYLVLPACRDPRIDSN